MQTSSTKKIQVTNDNEQLIQRLKNKFDITRAEIKRLIRQVGVNPQQLEQKIKEHMLRSLQKSSLGFSARLFHHHAHQA